MLRLRASLYNSFSSHIYPYDAHKMNFNFRQDAWVDGTISNLFETSNHSVSILYLTTYFCNFLDTKNRLCIDYNCFLIKN